MYVWEAQVDELLHNHEDLFPWRRVPGTIWALIERIDNKVYFALSWKRENALQAFHKRVLAGLLGAITMGRIVGGDNLREFIGLETELDEERRQQAARILLSGVPEIKVKEGKGGQSGLTDVPNLLDNC
jgi:hypothetical protein